MHKLTRLRTGLESFRKGFSHGCQVQREADGLGQEPSVWSLFVKSLKFSCSAILLVVVLIYVTKLPPFTAIVVLALAFALAFSLWEPFRKTVTRFSGGLVEVCKEVYLMLAGIVALLLTLAVIVTLVWVLISLIRWFWLNPIF